MQEVKKNLKIELIGIVLLFFSLFLFVSLLTWSPEDPPNPQKYSGKPGIKNFCGYFGAIISYHFFHNIGVTASYAFSVSLTVLSLFLLFNHLKHLVIRIITAQLLVFSASVIEVHFARDMFSYRIEGGVIGRFLANTLSSFVGTAGTVLSVCFAFVLCLFTLIDAPFKSLFTPFLSLFLSLWRSLKPEKGEGGEEKDSPAKMPRIEILKPKPSFNQKPFKLPKREGVKTEKPSSQEAEMLPIPSHNGDYILPPIAYLEKPTVSFNAKDEKSVEQGGRALAEALAKLGIEAEILGYNLGPSFISYRVRVADSIRLNKVKTSCEDLAFRLGVMSPLSIIGPLDGEPDTVAIQIPRNNREIVRTRELVPDEETRNGYASRMRIPLFLGRLSTSEPFVVDLTSLPHLLIAGATGSGKSICVHSILISILLTRTPEEVNLILIDPKMVELTHYADIPHLLIPVVTEMEHALSALVWASVEMDRRYRLLRTVAARDIKQFNEMPADLKKDALAKLLPEEAEQFKDAESRLP
ncbi:MAG: DNA translocase FtsK 4TM domain-containing protein, partial [Planctomycetota bacterium]|nr:DNA translocase FtsK 4TM domain-containing protein [Planctomycetota bacterium]